MSTLAGRILRIDALGVLAAVGISSVVYFLAVAPVLNTRSRAAVKLDLLEQQTRRAEDLESRTSRAQKELVRLKEKLAATSVPLFPASDINKRLDEIARMCEDHSLGVQRIDPGTPTPLSVGAGSRFTAVPIKLSGTGGFASVSRFLSKLLGEAYPDVEVRTLVLTADQPSAPTPESETAGASFLLELRWYAAPDASAASASPIAKD